MHQDAVAGAQSGSELVTLLVGAVRGISQVFIDRMTAAGFDDVRPTHGFALTLVGEHGTTATELGRRLGMTKQSAGEVVTHLARQGYVERRPDPEDRRARRITLTTRGRECVAIIWAELADVQGAWADAVGPTGLEELTTGLRKGLQTLRDDGRIPEALRQAWWWSV
ncbi:MAG TPA: MarR family transcriptional regulator [Yinghuangia sp.]|uniref:MarR family winged helix-turn-helix transcriptional regulator n=1 Tax=Yinghuangia sp. YIM S10712 TaxID=3436930 RepID=UPI002BD90327|nr:MarR family transcriptional regulator [Yinghuangia sp.]